MQTASNASADTQISAARLADLLRGSTYASLLIQYGRSTVPLADLSETFLGISVDRAQVMARDGTLVLPAFRLGGQRSPWLVHLYDLAQHIDAQRGAAGSVNVYQEARA